MHIARMSMEFAKNYCPDYHSTALQILVPMLDTPPTLSFTDDGVVLPCPIQPGALLRYYSLVWMKDNVNKIAEAIGP